MPAVVVPVRWAHRALLCRVLNLRGNRLDGSLHTEGFSLAGLASLQYVRCRRACCATGCDEAPS